MNISEATAIGLHSMVLLANEEAPVSASYIAETLGVSKHHLSKVLRDLVVAGFLASIKGPKGGFKLLPSQLNTSFMQILIAIDGSPKAAECLFAQKPCPKRKCILGNLLCRLNSEFRDYFNNTKIIDFKEK